MPCSARLTSTRRSKHSQQHSPSGLLSLNHPRTSLNSLSADLITQITSFSTLNSVKALSLVNHHLNNTTRVQLFSHINLTLPTHWGKRPNYNERGIGSAGDREVAKCIRMILGWSGFKRIHTGRFTMITGITMAPTLDTTSNFIDLLALYAPRLQRLMIIPPAYTCETSAFYDELCEFPTSSFPRLAHLRLHHSDGDDYSFLHILTRLAPNLTSLKVAGGNEMTEEKGFLASDDEEDMNEEQGLACDCCLGIVEGEDWTGRCERCQDRWEGCCGPGIPECECRADPHTFPLPTTLSSLRTVHLSYDLSTAKQLPAYLSGFFDNVPNMETLVLDHYKLVDKPFHSTAGFDIPQSLREHSGLKDLHWLGASSWLFRSICSAGGFDRLEKLVIKECIDTQAGCRVEFVHIPHLAALNTVVVLPIHDNTGKWDLAAPLNRFNPPSTDIEPLGQDSIQALLQCSLLTTIIYTPSGNMDLPSIPIPQWQQHGITASTITRYTGGGGDKSVIVVRNLSRSQCRGYWEDLEEDVKDGDTERWADIEIIECAILGDGADGEPMGHIESDYRWRTAMSYGERSIPTWLAKSLSSQIPSACETLEVQGTQVMSAEAKRMLDCWEAAEYPWDEPAWWKFVSLPGV